MKVKEFVEEYNKVSNKEAFIQKRLQTKYIPFVNKVSLCKSVAKTSSHIVTNGMELYKQDSPTSYLFYVLKLIETYTDIDISQKNIAEDYDMLCEKELIELLLDIIPAHEKVEFDSIMKMVSDDMYENERSVSAILGGIKDIFSFIIRDVINNNDEEVDNNV